MSKINLEEFFVSSLGSSENLKLELDRDINLVDTADKKILALADILFAFLPKSKKEELFRVVTSESILDLLRKERPDIHKILNEHQNGRTWINRRIEIFKVRFG